MTHGAYCVLYKVGTHLLPSQSHLAHSVIIAIDTRGNRLGGVTKRVQDMEPEFKPDILTPVGAVRCYTVPQECTNTHTGAQVRTHTFTFPENT